MWFVVQVSEGSVSWEDAWNMPLDEFEWIYARCDETNDRNNAAVNGMK